MADSEDEDGSLNLTGFLFGNINEKGELEDTEILDEVIYTSDESIADIFLFNLLDGLKTFTQQIETHKDTFQHDLFWSLFLFFFFFDKRYILSVIWENSSIALENWFFFLPLPVFKLFLKGLKIYMYPRLLSTTDTPMKGRFNC